MALNSIDGMPIINAKRPLTLHVTEVDIAGSDRKKPGNCAAARACYRELHADEVRIHLGRVYVRTRGAKSWTRYNTPPAMRNEIIAFDRGGDFEPGEYTLHVPHPAQRTKKAQGSTTNKTKPWKQRSKTPKRASPKVVKNVRTGPASHITDR